MTKIIIPPQNRDNAIASAVRFFHSLPEGKAFEVTVEQVKRKRSDPQNNALWGVAYKTLHEETGNDMDDLHLYFCGEFFGWVERDVMGQTRKVPRRTTTRNEEGKRDVLPWDEFADFYGFIQQRSAETVGVFVPDPDPDFHREQAGELK